MDAQFVGREISIEEAKLSENAPPAPGNQSSKFSESEGSLIRNQNPQEAELRSRCPPTSKTKAAHVNAC